LTFAAVCSARAEAIGGLSSVRMLFEGKPRTKIEGSQAQKEAGVLADFFHFEDRF